MSVVQYPEAMKLNDVQMWDNAAFDKGVDYSETSTNPNFSWSNQSFDSDCRKENVVPSVQVHNVIQNPVLKSILKIGVSEKKSSQGNANAVLDADKKLDSEIEDIEKEIGRLSSKLEELRLEKAKRKAKVVEKRGRVVAAKFMDPPKQAIRRSDEQRKSEESIGKLNTPRRGMSLCPSEIYSSANKMKQLGNSSKQALRKSDEQKMSKQSDSKNEITPVQSSLNRTRRGISLNPSEIYSAFSNFKQLGSKNEITPVQSSLNRTRRGISLNPSEIYSATRKLKKQESTPKSCYWKIQEIDELSVAKQRRKSMSVSPKSQCRPQIPKKPATTIGVKKMVKIEEEAISLIQPKKLFEGEKSKSKSGDSKNPVKNGRVVASRYSQITNGRSALKEIRKRSWSENEEECKTSDRKRVSLVGKKGPELVGKKCLFSERDEEEQNTKEYLKIRAVLLIDETPRDSGEVKRASQLVGRKPFFAPDDEEKLPVFSFEDDGFEETCFENEDVLL